MLIYNFFVAIFQHALINILLCSDSTSVEENSRRLLKVAWLSFPLGLVITLAACYLVLWWQDIAFSNPYAQAILINGNHVLFYFQPLYTALLPLLILFCFLVGLIIFRYIRLFMKPIEE